MIVAVSQWRSRKDQGGQIEIKGDQSEIKGRRTDMTNSPSQRLRIKMDQKTDVTKKD